MAPVPQSNPKGGYLARKADIDAAVSRVLNGGWYILGEEVRAFETEFAGFVGAGEAVGVANGTDAIELALRVVDVGPGDAVVTVSHTAVATVAAIERAGAVPVLVDVDPESYTMDPAALEAAVQTGAPVGRVKAVVVVHLYGHPADMPAILEIARRYDLRVIEDCAQAHGARLGDRAVGTLGDLASFSFYPTKNLGGCGDGGLVLTGDSDLAARVRRLAQYGWEPRFISQEPGLNSRLDELQAAILRVQLRGLEEDNEQRRRTAAAYDRGLPRSVLTLPAVAGGAHHVYHQYVVRTSERDALRTFLREREIGAALHYPEPVHVQPAYAGRVPCAGPLRVTEGLAKEILSLPMHPWLSADDVARVCSAVEDWARSRR